MVQHGGDISAASDPGTLTRFTLRLVNVFPQAVLPELSNWHDRRVWILSPTKQGGALLAGVLDEAGLLNVKVAQTDPKVLQQVSVADPDLLMVDLASAPENARPLAEWLVQLPFQCPVLAYGPLEAVQAFKEVRDLPQLEVISPFNPLRLLRGVEALFKETPVQTGAAGD